MFTHWNSSFAKIQAFRLAPWAIVQQIYLDFNSSVAWKTSSRYAKILLLFINVYIHSVYSKAMCSLFWRNQYHIVTIHSGQGHNLWIKLAHSSILFFHICVNDLIFCVFVNSVLMQIYLPNFRSIWGRSYRISQKCSSTLDQQNLSAPCSQPVRSLEAFYDLYRWKEMEGWKTASWKRRICGWKLLPLHTSTESNSRLEENVSNNVLITCFKSCCL